MLAREPLYNELTLVVSRKTWPFMYLMNELILIQQQSGISRYIELIASYRTTDLRIQQTFASGAITEDEIVPLKVAHIEGALFLLFFGYIVATCCFIVEHSWHKLKHLSNSSS